MAQAVEGLPSKHESPKLKIAVSPTKSKTNKQKNPGILPALGRQKEFEGSLGYIATPNPKTKRFSSNV
jgi:hypothetical protein